MDLNKPEPSPKKNELPAVWDLVIADMLDRDFQGSAKYGTQLKPFNGRNSLVDAYQEVLDLAVYLRQTIFEVEDLKAEMLAIKSDLVQIVQQYYDYRYKGNEPNARQALLWLLSEVGELVDAWMGGQNELIPLDFEDWRVLDLARKVGAMAEDRVMSERDWLRNGDRLEDPSVADEVGDVLMMLTRFSLEAGTGDPAACMLAKMESKGFGAHAVRPNAERAHAVRPDTPSVPTVE